jgi:hypothetical protein
VKLLLEPPILIPFLFCDHLCGRVCTHPFIHSFIHYCTKLCPHNRTDQGEVWLTVSDVKVVAQWQIVDLPNRILSRCWGRHICAVRWDLCYFWPRVCNEAEGLGLYLLGRSDWIRLWLDSGSVPVASLNWQFLTAIVGGWNLSHCGN